MRLTVWVLFLLYRIAVGQRGAELILEMTTAPPRTLETTTAYDSWSSRSDSRYGVGGSASVGHSGGSVSYGQTGQSGSHGWSASASGSADPYGSQRASGQASTYGQSSSGGGREDYYRYGSQQQPSPTDRYGAGYGSRYGSQQPAAPSSRYDSRYDQNRGAAEAYWQQQRPIDYSLYPPTLKSMALSENTIYVYWIDPANANRKNHSEGSTKYNIKYNALSGSSTEEQTIEATGKDVTLSNLEPGTEYSISIQADRNGRVTGWSAPLRNRTLAQLPIQPPSNLTADPLDRSARITLSPPDGFKGVINSYLILYAPSGSTGAQRVWQEQQIPGGYAGSTSTVTLQNLRPDEEYFYTVQAITTRGAGPFSDIQNFKTLSYGARRYDGQYDRQYPTYAPPGVDYGYGQATPSPAGGSAYGGEYTPDYYYPTYPRETDHATSTPDYVLPEQYQTPQYVLPEEYDRRYETRVPYGGGNERTTQDYWGSRGGGADYYGVTASPDRSDGQQWSPYWEAATLSPNEGAGVHGGYHGQGQPGGEQAEALGPAPPTGLTVDILEEATSAVVLWTPSPATDVTEYEVQYNYDQSEDVPWKSVTVPGGESQAIADGLEKEKWVYFRVRAKGNQGWGAFSDMKPQYTRYTGPSYPASGSEDSGNGVSAGGSASMTGSHSEYSEAADHEAHPEDHEPEPTEDGNEEELILESPVSSTTSTV